MGVASSTRLTRVEPVPRTVSFVDAATSRFMAWYLRRAVYPARARWLDAGARSIDAATILRALASDRPDGRPILVVYWGADAVALAALPFVEPAFLAGARTVTFLFDETFGGRVCAALVEDLGCRYVMLARPGKPARFDQLREVMRRGGSYAFAVDGGGPYFEVGNGVASLARTLKAFVVPLAAVATPALPWPHPSRISFPLPYCRTTVALGRPIDGLAADRESVVKEIGSELRLLGRIARHQRTPGASGT